MIFKRKRKQVGGAAPASIISNNSPPPQHQLFTNVQNIPFGSDSSHQILNQYPPTSLPSSQSYPPLQAPPLCNGTAPYDSTWRAPPTSVAQSLQSRNDGIGDWQHRTTEYLNQGAAVCDLISNKLNAVITSIDGERFSGDERELAVYQYPQPVDENGRIRATREISRSANEAFSSAATSTNYFAKANLYANARLPNSLLPLKLYMPTYPLLCLAAQFSQRVYTRPAGAESETHVNADWRHGTKAMVIKSVPVDDMNTVVFAIRGSQTFMDWAVNLNSAPASPADFLDDPGNLCHSGFLSVARKMIKPVAARLRSLLEEDPSRSSCSLLITGHSAGGAVASLLYAHMMAAEVESELNILTDCFKRVHCITFGAPPVSLLALQKPTIPRRRKSLFMSFINEGDPVPRADKAYVRSLLDLYSSPAPGSPCMSNLLPSVPNVSKPVMLNLGFKVGKRPKPVKAASAPVLPAVVWKVPPAPLCNAGRLVLLRMRPGGRTDDDVQACITSDEQIRGVVYGDPLMHMMKVYARRVEILATNAVTARV
ncbi:MAG: hypothetical protein M1812_001229 [Candelaria pacifica]|nr:MAG: hypothetical protein M1812_001229 [Candelaria pacifica]